MSYITGPGTPRMDDGPGYTPEDFGDLDQVALDSGSYEEGLDGDQGYEVEPSGLFSTPGRTIMIVSSVIVLVFVFAGLAWLLGARARAGSQDTLSAVTIGGAGTNTAGLKTGVRVGAIAPDFELQDAFTNRPVKLASFRGRPVWVNFWASWCPPCKAEMPEMKIRYDKYRDKDLVILGIDSGEDAATVKQFTKLNGYDWTFVLDRDQRVDLMYYVSGLPTHLFIDKGGVIRALQVGGIPGSLMDSSLSKIIDQ